MYRKLPHCRNIAIPLLSLAFSISCNNHSDKSGNDQNQQATELVPNINYTLSAIFPHDNNAYTEGLLFHEGKLFESTGYNKEYPLTQSLFGIVDLKTGKIQPKVELDKNIYWGEGIAFLKEKWYQLTYTAKIGFIYDGKTFRKLGEFNLPGQEGWGMTTDGEYLIMSDGSEKLYWINPENFQTIKKLVVTDDKGIVLYLNELEYLKGSIYANVYGTNTIVRIDPQQGKVTGRLDLSSLTLDAKSKFAGAQEMNGIAYDSTNDRVLLTGKLWPSIYEIRITAP